MSLIIFEPIITEKSINLADKNKYVFKVDSKTTQNEIKKEIERIFKVHVEKVNTITKKAKKRRMGKTFGKTTGFKKAVVTLKKGEKIKEFESGK